MPIDALSILCAQLTRDLFTIAKFLFYAHYVATMVLSCIISEIIKRQIGGKSRFQANITMILQTRHEYRKPSWVAYDDFRSAFDSVDRDSLWLLLRSKGIPEKILNLLEDLYSNTLSCQS